MVKNIIVQSLMICSFGAPWGTNMNDLMSCWMELDGHGHCSPFRLCHSLLKNTNLFSVKWTNGSLSFSETVYLASLYNTDQGSRINQLLKKIWMSKNCWGSSEENIWHRQTRVLKSTFRQMDQSCMSKDTWLEKRMNLAYGIRLNNGLHTRVNGRMIRDLCFIW